MNTTSTTNAPAQNIIRIALPVKDGRLHGHFGGSREFLFVDADATTRTVIARQTKPAPPHTPGAFPRWLREEGARVVIAGGIGQRALDNFALHGVTVRAGQADALVETQIALYLAGQLTAAPSGCAHHGEPGHHHHDHDHEPGHHHH
jgi:predicted Fe-Mo cluster-binding NifX family protein